LQGEDVAKVFIPTQLRSLTGGCDQVELDGATLGELLDALEETFPGIRRRITDGDRLAAWLSVVVDGSLVNKSLWTPIAADSEVHLLPAISGGGR
jgi:molybdopterin converting factor small subunit